jgi:hypothetical protein
LPENRGSLWRNGGAERCAYYLLPDEQFLAGFGSRATACSPYERLALPDAATIKKAGSIAGFKSNKV